jgi:hypothetical protein
MSRACLDTLARQLPSSQPIARPGGRVLLGSQDGAIAVHDGSDVDVLVRVDPASPTA